MIVIIEGIDRVGKSTLCDMIKDQLNFKQLNAKLICTSKDAYTLDAVYNDRLSAQTDLLELIDNENIVIDRFHLSQAVYSSIERNGDILNAVKIDERLSKLNTILVHVEPTDIEWSSKQDGRDLRDYYKVFCDMFKMSKMRKIAVDYNTLQLAVKVIGETNGNCR